MSRDPGEVLRDRARLLARPVEDDAAPRDAVEVLRWQRGRQAFAIAVAAVRGITDAGRLAAVPQAPPTLAGMVAFRGGLLAVYDPAALVGAGTGHPAAAPWALVVDDDAPFALLADGLPEIAAVTEAGLRPPTGDLPADTRRCVRGVTRTGCVLFAAEALGRDPRLSLSTSREANQP